VNLLKAIYRAVFPAMELMLGMGIAQMIATAQVFASNQRLFAQMTAVADAGFQPVPNANVLPRLLDLENAVFGGVLFTLSVGAALSLLSLAAAWLWSRCGSKRRWTAAVLVTLLAGGIVYMNRRGFDGWATLYFVLIPPIVFGLAARSPLVRQAASERGRTGLRFLPLAVLALGWFAQYDRHLFVDLRDHLLMSNSVGERVSSFYYRYTLYPAEVFKTLDQRLIKTVASPAADAGTRSADVKRELIRRDYLPVAIPQDADLSLRFEGDRLAFLHRGRIVWQNTIAHFLADPGRAISEISARADRFGFFRSVAFYGVLLAFPIVLYLLLFALIHLGCRLASGPRRAEAAAAALCLLIGLAILAHFHLSREDPPPPGAIETALESDRWQQRVAGLKAIRGRNFDITGSPAYERMLRSPFPQERYWLAQSLGASPNPRAFADLIHLLGDPQINVRTMALEGLGRRRDPRAVHPILNFLKRSHEWYDQLYAYQALRMLRWDQTRLN
jgi:hypothetical protein